MVFEVIAIGAASKMTNYVGTIANPMLEDPFRQYAWRAETPAAACPPAPSTSRSPKRAVHIYKKISLRTSQTATS